VLQCSGGHTSVPPWEPTLWTLPFVLRRRIMTVTITMIQDEDGAFIVACPAIAGCVSQGRTRDEAQENIRDAIRECLAVQREQSLPLTI
jgi:predicted RNase H-like HicB family nuclease